MDSEFSSYDKLKSMLQNGSSGARLQCLRNITNNFSVERRLGEGGFGTVYKGVLQNGETVAVKRFNSSIPGVKEDRQFENEAYHLMRLKHPNIVLLVGCCSETENEYIEYNGKYIYAEKLERLLCLEYMPKGSLREYISDECSGLEWGTRYKIIEGICYGLHYLHDDWQLNAPIVHMDLKPANILLDNNMVPKIADFGLSRLFIEEKTWTITKSLNGTLGYMAPEYIDKGLITTKSDIFSLGVIIIEIVTGHRDYPVETAISSQEFIELVLKNWRNRQIMSMHTSLIDYEQIRRCIQIGLVCVKFDRLKRPTISQIIKMLHGLESADFSGKKEENVKISDAMVAKSYSEFSNIISSIENMLSKIKDKRVQYLVKTKPKRRLRNGGIMYSKKSQSSVYKTKISSENTEAKFLQTDLASKSSQENMDNLAYPAVVNQHNLSKKASLISETDAAILSPENNRSSCMDCELADFIREIINTSVLSVSSIWSHLEQSDGSNILRPSLLEELNSNARVVLPDGDKNVFRANRKLLFDRVNELCVEYTYNFNASYATWSLGRKLSVAVYRHTWVQRVYRHTCRKAIKIQPEDLDLCAVLDTAVAIFPNSWIDHKVETYEISRDVSDILIGEWIKELIYELFLF